jgi:hypothetical protein
MRNKLVSLILIALASGYILPVIAQDSGDAAQRAHELRMQLMDVQNREAELKARLEQLEFDLKPENIERHFSAVGSTRPEEQREARRRQLQTEKDLTVNQLEQLSVSRSRLETAIGEADAKAYQQSALGSSSLEPRNPVRFLLASRIAMTSLIGLMIVLGLILYAVYRRRTAIRNSIKPS